MNFGLIGAHRSGKTTLAETVSNETGLPLVLTSSSAVCKAMGINPAEQMSLVVRMNLQKAILRNAVDAWKLEKEGFITDRTPIDMIAYTMADIGPETASDPRLAMLVAEYIEECYEAYNNNFHGAMFVPSVIPIVEDRNKATAACNKPYIEHVSMLMLGFATDKRSRVAFHYLSRDCLAIKDRVGAVSGTIENFSERYREIVEHAVIN